MQGVQTLFSVLRTEDGEAYLEKLIAYHCLLVVKKLRPAVMLSFRPGRDARFFRCWKRHRDAVLTRLSLRYAVVAASRERMCVLFYDEALLGEQLGDERTQELLATFGYDAFTVPQAIGKLRTRFSSCPCPHEIGLFLGYPAGDVEQFLQKDGKDYRYCGYWKVYEDVEIRREQFREFDRLRGAMADLLSKGVDSAVALQMI